MRTTANTIRKIAAIAAAMTMAMSTLGATVSAQTVFFADVNGSNAVMALPMESTDTVVYADKNSVSIGSGETAYVLLTVYGSRNLEVITSDGKVASAELCRDGYNGNSILLNINGIDGGCANIMVVSRDNRDVLCTVKVDVNGISESALYSPYYTVYSFATNAYYRTYEDAMAVSGNYSACIYTGEVDSSASADTYHRFYSANTNLFYASYDMALAASNGFAGLVEIWSEPVFIF